MIKSRKKIQILPILMICNPAEIDSYLSPCLQSLSAQSCLNKGVSIHINLMVFQCANKQENNRKLNNLLAKFGTVNLKINWTYTDLDCGYGVKQNLLFKKIFNRKNDADYFLMLNPDTILDSQCLEHLINAATSNAKAYILEAKQFPNENPYRYFDEKTFEISWCSGACVLVSTQFFKMVEGFDENIYLYCEDIDLSWKAWINGGSCIYVPWAICCHSTTGLFKGIYKQHSNDEHLYNSGLGYLILSYKYFSLFPYKYESAISIFRTTHALNEWTKIRCLERFGQFSKNLLQINQTSDHIVIHGIGEYGIKEAEKITNL